MQWAMDTKLKADIYRSTNILLLGLIVILTITGLMAFFLLPAGWVMDVHRVASWGLVVLLPWKVLISTRSLKRGLGKRFDRNVVVILSILMAGMAIPSLILGLLWTWNIGPELLWLRQTMLSWHWILALVLLAPLAVHVWRRWPKPKASDFTSRRGAMRMIGVAAFGVVGWLLAETLAEARSAEDAPRRITGSRRKGAFTGNDFPVRSERRPDLDVKGWQLTIEGAVERPLSLSLAEIEALPYHEIDAILDCTDGWWTIQRWGGARLADMLGTAGVKDNALALRITSVTGYTQIYTMREAQDILIATHVGGEVLSTGHGYPVRAIVPNRRGWFWVKWLGEIIVMDSIDEVLAQPLSIR